MLKKYARRADLVQEKVCLYALAQAYRREKFSIRHLIPSHRRWQQLLLPVYNRQFSTGEAMLCPDAKSA
jgi:hypothetical protein